MSVGVYACRPPELLVTSQHSYVNIAQISDLHLTNSDCANAQRFMQILEMALADGADLLLLTGDLVDDGDSAVYMWLFDKIIATGVPYACIAGNHDVTIELGKHLPFDQRKYLATECDTRLLGCRRIQISSAVDNHGVQKSTWHLLLLNSAVAGQGYGALDDESLIWLDETLTALDNEGDPVLIALHHHPVPIGSAWLDRLMLTNHTVFWSVIKKHPLVHTILCGHVHQAQNLQINGDLQNCNLSATIEPSRLDPHGAARLPKPMQIDCFAHTPDDIWCLSAPAVDRHFLPFSDSFAIDSIGGGYRMIQLCNTGKLATWIKRQDTISF